jgi:predicted RNA-binding protein with PIN domain
MLIIDGYNLIFARESRPDKEPESLEQQRNKLINRLRDYNRPRNEYIIIAFDGESNHLYPERRKEDKNIEVIFSQAGQTADELILNIASTSDNPKNIEVITSDRELADGIKRLKAKICSSAEFLERLNKPAKEDAKYNQSSGGDEPIEKVIGLSPAEVEAWMKIFGND